MQEPIVPTLSSDRPDPILLKSALKKDAQNGMLYDESLGIDKKVSTLAIGGMILNTAPQATAIFDSFFAAGGTVLDTAYVYGKGEVDRLLGEWVNSRGVREQVVVIAKGAHTPHCRPDAIAPQLAESLERIGTGYTDLYFMHRDDPAVPVGEFVDVLDELCHAGKIRKYGGSNWSLARMDEANAYARAHGKRGFELLSNNFSLAEMVAPMWPGCISSSDPDSIAWLQRTQTPIFAWSSQARGFFTDRAGRDKFDDPTLVNCWYSDLNFARRDRVHALARRLKISPAQVALAYLFVQPFPVFPIIGPASLEELRDSTGALSVDLSPADANWVRTGKQ
jgi:aryl-alcohol dehydrogenase-like predicted oxidoreductase